MRCRARENRKDALGASTSTRKVGKKLGPPLDFIDDDQATEPSEGQLGIAEPGKIVRILKIEDVRAGSEVSA